MAARGGQTIGENAAGASGADDDIVEGLRIGLHRHQTWIDPGTQRLQQSPWITISRLARVFYAATELSFSYSCRDNYCLVPIQCGIMFSVVRF